MTRRIGKNCGCARWCPSFATICVDCGAPMGFRILENLASYLTGDSGTGRTQRPKAQTSNRYGKDLRLRKDKP